ncbi:hypothetical protein BKA70DRAFT_1221646 [Coprinopsis sp. MPI-PUGE-AT-0042]|nr:hypothetical protein BKA70DRAFT_1221646 [Coprinopsis sp. MPI-PUGE-AT-0042]
MSTLPLHCCCPHCHCLVTAVISPATSLLPLPRCLPPPPSPSPSLHFPVPPTSRHSTDASSRTGHVFGSYHRRFKANDTNPCDPHPLALTTNTHYVNVAHGPFPATSQPSHSLPSTCQSTTLTAKLPYHIASQPCHQRNTAMHPLPPLRMYLQPAHHTLAVKTNHSCRMANTITPRDSKRCRGDEADSSPADEDDEDKGGGEGGEETSDEMSQAAEAASSSAAEVYDGDLEQEEPEPPRRTCPPPAAPSSDILENELNFPSSLIKTVPKKTKAVAAPKATATVTPTTKCPATALKQTIQPAASTTTTTKAKPAVKATAKPAIKTKPTVKAPVDNSTTGTENILQALNASIAPPPRKMANGGSIILPPYCLSTAAVGRQYYSTFW